MISTSNINIIFSDRELIDAILNKNEKYIIYLMDGLVMPTIKRLLFSKGGALIKNNYFGIEHDICQDFFLFLSENNWKILSEFRFESTLKTYLYSVLYRFIQKKYRTENQNSRVQVPINELALSMMDNSADILDQVIFKQIKMKILEYVKKNLGDINHSVLVYSLAGYSPAEIAQKMETSIGSIDARKHRIKTLLKKYIHEEN